MCGIFGVLATRDTPLSPAALKTTVADLFRLSESRGKEAAGVAVLTADAIQVYKEAIPASTMIRRAEYHELWSRVLRNGSSPRNGRLSQPVTIIGHSRLVTTGGQENRLNNQPVINSGAVGIHNGIIVNDEALWRAFPAMPRNGRVDSEVILALIRKYCAEQGSLISAVRETFRLIQGAASIAVIFEDLDHLLLATNNGSLYLCGGPEAKTMIFASEKHILHTLIRKHSLERVLGSADILQVRPGQGWLIDLNDLGRRRFSLISQEKSEPAVGPKSTHRRLVDIEPAGEETPGHGRHRPAGSNRYSPDHPPPDGANRAAIDALRRCRKCILPETMPFIEFDEQGVCNYCRHYRKIELQGREALEEILGRYRDRSGEKPDCLVGLSGGRDSMYGLHYIKTELRMNPIAFTYDWGMVTDLARRNISRICGKLGIEHILVSAPIARKRSYIHKNVSAWLKKPDLGMIPLFMAGDKQYFYHAKKLKKQTGVPIIMLCENMLERTDFKSGFAGVRPSNMDADHVYTLPVLSKLAMVAHYGRQYLTNPAYLNSSVPDTLFAYACYYLISRDYINLYRFIEWNEDEINSTLTREYDWELATDTQSTWRIGDGTASFYNYLYYTVAGFTEHETFRSNQVRPGIITREQALAMARRDNQPRWESIQWYLDTIGLGDEFNSVIQRINTIPKLYDERTCC